MDERLYRAATEGNTEILLNLIREDPLILERTNSTTTTHLETPLHIAAMLGHAEFVEELLRRRPGLAGELDSRRSTALHSASAKGHAGVVEALLRAHPDSCFARDRDGRNPLHVAAVMGRIDALREMLRVKPDAARALIKNGGNILHLCVEHSQLEALKIVVENVDFQQLLNGRDRNGNTVLHLAVGDKQVETAEFLLSVAGMDLNAVNLSGMTAMDILIQRRRDTRDIEMEESLQRAGAIGAKNSTAATFLRQNKSDNPDRLCSCKSIEKNLKKKRAKNNEDWLDKKRSAIIVVASLIATMAFQVGTNPPSKIWPDAQAANSTQPASSNSTQPASSPWNDPKSALYYVRKASDYLKKGERFYIINTISFIASLSIILLLMSGLPLNSRFFVWILLVITWVAISDIALSYAVAVILLTPSDEERSINAVVAVTVFAWICLMTLLLLGHTIRLSVKMVRMFLKMVKLLIKSLSRRRRRPPASAVYTYNSRV